jgi:uncharacterized protein
VTINEGELLAPTRRTVSLLDVFLVLAAGIAAGILASVVVYLLINVVAGPVEDMSEIVVGSIGSSLIYAGVVGATHLLVVRRKGWTWRDVGLRRTERNFLPMTLLVWFGTFVATVAVALFITNVIGEQPPSVRDQLGVDQVTLGGGEIAWLFFVSVLMAPIAEEILFRGLLFDALRRRWPFWPVALVTAVLFALTHRSLLTIPALTVLGVALAWLRARFDSLYPAITLHALNNAVAITLFVLTTNAS